MATNAELAASCLGQTPLVIGLLKSLYKQDRNVVLSPYSLVSAMAMLMPGSEGNSRYELVKALFDQQAKDATGADRHVEVFGQLNKANLEKNDQTLHVANMLYSHLKFPLKPEYVATLSKQFHAVGKELDFIGAKSVALQAINSDVEKATKGLIKNLLEDIDPQIRVILVNAIYFKGLWAVPFDKGDTNEQGEFTKSSGAVVRTPLMFTKKKFPFYYDQAAKAKYVQLDYKSGGNIAMVLALPDEGVSLESYIRSSLKSETLHQTLDKLEKADDVNLTLPRFKIESTHYLASPLQQLGIRDIFGPKANLTRVSASGEQLYVSDVIQKAVIEVNEEGTEAAAATAIMMRCLMLTPEVDFTANRPFLYMLVAKHDTAARQILFVGTVEDPTKSQ